MNSDRFAISLDLINRHYQEPNRNRYESRYFWEELYPLISASGFRSIEIPYEPVWQFGGRSGVPMNRYCINTKYGTAGQYRERLKDSGIDHVAGLTFDPNLFMRNDNLGFFFGASGHFAGEALAHAADLGAGYLAISPSAYYGRTAHYHPDIEAKLSTFTERATDWLQGLATKAEALGVTLVLRQDYWSLFRGERFFALLDALPASVKLDVDAAHLTIAGLDPLALIAEQSGRIGSVHLTDTAFIDTDQTWKSANPEFPEHRATQIFRDPGTGDVKLGEIVSQLERLNYQGPLVWSARQTRDPFRALLRTRAFLNQLTH